MHSSEINFISFINTCLLSEKNAIFSHENAACGDYMEKAKFLRALEFLFVWEHFVRGLVRIALPSGEISCGIKLYQSDIYFTIIIILWSTSRAFLLLSLHTHT